MSEERSNEDGLDCLAGLKVRVSEILHEALRGYDMSTRYRGKDGYVRWGLVEKDIHAAIDEANMAMAGLIRCHRAPTPCTPPSKRIN